MRSHIRQQQTRAVRTAYSATTRTHTTKFFSLIRCVIASPSCVFGSTCFCSPYLSRCQYRQPSAPWGHEAVLTFSSNPQLWVESRVLHMNYACLDARVLSNTSAIIIETIEKTIPDGSIIRQQEGETWSGRSPACPANLTTTHTEGTFTNTSWSPTAHSHMLHCVCVYVWNYVERITLAFTKT